MIDRYIDSQNFSLGKDQFTWLITGVAGFIGSNLLESLLKQNQSVKGLDNFSTGKRRNLEEVRDSVTAEQWSRFVLIEGDICSLDDCRKVTHSIDYVLHHAASISVPESIENPLFTNINNVDGFLNMLVASRDSGVKRFIYATSSATYGNQADFSAIEHKTGELQSPYALSKLVNELYADLFYRVYGFESVGLRYFNVYGPRQDPNGAYAAVIPTWIDAMMKGESVFINGDGETSRDFCYIDDVVQANLLAAMVNNPDAVNQVYNVAVGESTSLNKLFEYMKNSLDERYIKYEHVKPIYRNFRPGDVRFSQADITKAKRLLDYVPGYTIDKGLQVAVDWYLKLFKVREPGLSLI